VVLKSGSQTQLVPLSQLSQQDRDYIESQLNKKRDDDEGQPIRIWTDRLGNQITASFLRMNDTQVGLLEGGRPRAIAFMELSEADRKHIKDLLRQQGQQEQVAALEQHEEEAAKAAAAAREAARQSAPPPPSYSPPSSPFMEEMRARQEQARQAEEQRRQEQAQRDAERRQRDQEAQQQRLAQQEEQRQRMAEQQQQFQQQMAEQSRQRMERMTNLPSGPMMVTEHICSKCRKTVSEDIGAGGNCPHCGAFFAWSEGPGGQRQYASNSGSSDSGRFRMSGRAIKGIVFIVVFLVGGAAALWRKIAGE
jgi:hypothetical protein